MKSKNGKRILFANFPADGHFNPLTGLAVYLDQAGYDVRWYTSRSYEQKLKKLQIRSYPFKNAVDVSDGNFDKVFPGRQKYRTAIGKLRFDIIHAFILRGPEYYRDILNIYHEFPFDLLIADCAFTGIPFVKDLMDIPVISVGVLPLTETSRDLPPVGLGMEPSYTLFGKLKQAFLRAFAKAVLFKKPNSILHRLLDEHNIPHQNESVFDMVIRKSDLLLQSGTPGFEYYRSDLGKNIRYIGSLLPYNRGNEKNWHDDRLHVYDKVVLVTQGTVEKDINKLIIPTLEAFKNTDVLVVCTTGGSGTAFLREHYPYANIIVEDFIPFAEVMPYADVYITNGGYGGVMLGIENRIPMVVAGTHEGKNEINARINYFKMGIDLKTERPAARQIKNAVEKIFRDPVYKISVEKLAGEFTRYNTLELVHEYVSGLLTESKQKKVA